MNDAVFSPLCFYEQEGSTRHKENATQYFHLLRQQAKIDETANAKTVASYHEQLSKIQALETAIHKLKRTRTLSIIGLILAFFVIIFSVFSSEMIEAGKTALTAFTLIAVIVGIVVLCKQLNAQITSFQTELCKNRSVGDALLEKATAQMQPLNSLYSDFDATNLVQKTFPLLSFDDCFNEKRYNELVNSYGYADKSNENSSAVVRLSGELYGDPFLFERNLNHEIVPFVYTGTLTISWTTTERDAQGNSVTRHHTQTLYANVTKPKPVYHFQSLLSYCNDAVDELCFSRTYQHVEDKSEAALQHKLRKGERKLQRMEMNALRKGKNFTELANTEFEVLFGATNRNDELQFRQMFTPVAQENLLQLLLNQDGYGDDFCFVKNKKINTIQSEHSANTHLSALPRYYSTYDFSKAEKIFVDFHCEFFKSVFFDFAPILSIPLFKEFSLIRNDNKTGEPTYHILEALAYELEERLRPTDCATHLIVKILSTQKNKDFWKAEVVAKGYKATPRTDYVSKLGGDGHIHQVPVDWTEYTPTQRISTMHVYPYGKPINLSPNAVSLRGIYAYVP